uniref:Uncharacterized protein n=1 Tax=Anguilla anguilla TaxID=7936 RepID=A0A0E9VUT6_ANGAN
MNSFALYTFFKKACASFIHLFSNRLRHGKIT